jgi:hypothetical protein
VVVGADGSVYVTAYDAGTGVLKFNANLTGQTTFIANGTSTGTSGGTALTLSNPTGMVFDKNGNLWVANVYAPGGSVTGSGPSKQNFVSEFSSTGTWIRTIDSNGNNLYTVFGLSLGKDGNIYAASYNGGEITEINTTTNTASTFITLTSGYAPKYATWGSDAVTYVPEPKAYGMITIGAVALLLAFRFLKRMLSLTA